jgi:hypothetical protein
MKRVISIILCLLFCNTVFAQEEVYKRYKLPIGTRVEDSEQSYQCFNLGEYKLLLKMDSDLRKADNTLVAFSETYVLHLQKINDLEDIIKLDDKTHSLAMSEILRKDKLVTDLAKENVKLNNELNRRKRIFRITLGVGAALVAGVFAGTYLGLKL